MRHWQEFRHIRHDITDYVVHLTKPQTSPYLNAHEVMTEILRSGYIRATFARLGNRIQSTPRPTVKGPFPAVCFSDTPLWALAQMNDEGILRRRYSGIGIAFHKSHVFLAGARPVLYGDEQMLGRKLCETDPGFQPGREIYYGGLPPHLQYLWVRYEPAPPDSDDYPVDFTWEREWRYCPENQYGLEVAPSYACRHQVLIVEHDFDIRPFQQVLAGLATANPCLQHMVNRVVSLETTQRMLREGRTEFSRLETYPDLR